MKFAANSSLGVQRQTLCARRFAINFLTRAVNFALVAEEIISADGKSPVGEQSGSEGGVSVSFLIWNRFHFFALITRLQPKLDQRAKSRRQQHSQDQIIRRRRVRCTRAKYKELSEGERNALSCYLGK